MRPNDGGNAIQDAYDQGRFDERVVIVELLMLKVKAGEIGKEDGSKMVEFIAKNQGGVTK